MLLTWLQSDERMHWLYTRILPLQRNKLNSCQAIRRGFRDILFWCPLKSNHQLCCLLGEHSHNPQYQSVLQLLLRQHVCDWIIKEASFFLCFLKAAGFLNFRQDEWCRTGVFLLKCLCISFFPQVLQIEAMFENSLKTISFSVHPNLACWIMGIC